MSTKTRHSERKFLTTSDVARMAGRSRAQILKRWKEGLIPARNANARGKQLRFIDSPEIRMWCEMERRGHDYWLLKLIETIVDCIAFRDRGGDILRSEIIADVLRQLLDAKDAKQLIRNWACALRDQRFEDLPHVP